MPAKWKKVILTVEKRLEIHYYIKKPVTYTVIAEKYGIGRSTITDMKNSEAKLQSFIDHQSLISLIWTNSVIWTDLELNWHKAVRIMEVPLYIHVHWCCRQKTYSQTGRINLHFYGFYEKSVPHEMEKLWPVTLEQQMKLFYSLRWWSTENYL